MKEITSTKNNQLKEWKNYTKKYQEELNQYIIEGDFIYWRRLKANATDVQWILFNQRGQQEWGTWLLAEQETEN